MRLKKLAIGATLSVMVLFGDVAASAEYYSEDYGHFTAAYEAYYAAKAAKDFKTSTDAYADAISSIAKAVKAEPGRVDYLTLASLIYRGKGGISYAKKYFSEAEKAARAKINAVPKDIGAHLDYAILCYAGDARFSEKALAYKREAQREASKTIELCERALKEGTENVGVRRAEAMAHLIKGNKKECKKILQLAAKESDTDKFVADLYNDTVDKNKWFWDIKEVDKEFLLYMMMNVKVNIGLQ